jgi:hypothetical protein
LIVKQTHQIPTYPPYYLVVALTMMLMVKAAMEKIGPRRKQKVWREGRAMAIAAVCMAFALAVVL